jgi:hypothetical protein
VWETAAGIDEDDEKMSEPLPPVSNARRIGLTALAASWATLTPWFGR